MIGQDARNTQQPCLQNVESLGLAIISRHTQHIKLADDLKLLLSRLRAPKPFDLSGRDTFCLCTQFLEPPAML